MCQVHPECEHCTWPCRLGPAWSTRVRCAFFCGPRSNLRHVLRSLGLVCCREILITQPLFEAGIVTELLKQFCVVGEQFDDDPFQRLVVLDTSVLLVGVL